jgi:hypothetical protein
MGIDLVYFSDCSIRFWNCYDGVLFLVFHFISIGLHEGDRVVVLLAFLLAAMMAIVW